MVWADKDFARQMWSDAAAIPDAALDTHLAVATATLTPYAPALADDTAPIPDSYRLACVYQAREQVNALLRDGADLVNMGDYAVRVRPLTAAVKSLLRPQSGRPRFGGVTAPASAPPP